mmetsp:Transcript_35947/g.38936  ORF Transcript_35947/g.38936 Transcript_35947/m.38936 type:complete len:116 (-) Transcript_35947:10-357(-)
MDMAGSGEENKTAVARKEQTAVAVTLPTFMSQQWVLAPNNNVFSKLSRCCESFCQGRQRTLRFDETVLTTKKEFVGSITNVAIKQQQTGRNHVVMIGFIFIYILCRRRKSNRSLV